MVGFCSSAVFRTDTNKGAHPNPLPSVITVRDSEECALNCLDLQIDPLNFQLEDDGMFKPVITSSRTTVSSSVCVAPQIELIIIILWTLNRTVSSGGNRWLHRWIRYHVE